MYNEKMFRVRFTPEEMHRIRERLGFATLFPYVQPENSKFSLDFAYNDQRMVASFLVQMAIAKEKFENLQNAELHLPNGKIDTLKMGVPFSWVEPSALPKAGVFHCTYKCAPENRRFEFRRASAAATGFPMDIQESAVSWWSGLSEAPEDVVELLSWLLTKFSSMDEAFKVAVGSKAAMNKLQFETFLKEQGLTKFKGKGDVEEQRITGVFRWLDPGGDGTLSRLEFRIMQELWNEMDLCLREFAQFLSFKYGEDLELAWCMLDKNCDGSISMSEWMSAVEDIGYFGPAEIVFKFIDSDDDHSIQQEEFELLENYVLDRQQAAEGRHLTRTSSMHTAKAIRDRAASCPGTT
jgi:Ca2+-binding EF-hand superfamily protein